MTAQTLTRSVIGSTGSSNESLSSTIGETVIQTGNTNTIILTQGFQQADKITGTFIDPLLGEASFSLYPNPTADKLILEIGTDKQRNLQVAFVDMRGRMVSESVNFQTGNGQPVELDVSHFATATYSLMLKNEQGKVLKSLRFQKID